MKVAFYVIGGLIVLSGDIWVLQGINILPGSFITGDPQWAVNGVIAIAVGSAIIYLVRRMK